jgi:DNA-binding transcriptional LysR family regulator
MGSIRLPLSQLHLDRLVHFHAIARQRSLKAAAAALHLTPPALTRSLQKLEGELGVVLCTRARTGLRLTDEGRRLLRTTDRVVAELDHYLDAPEPPEAYAGIVGLGFLGALRVPKLDAALDAMLRRFPHCRPNLVVASSDDLARLVDADELDLAFSVFDRELPRLRYRPVSRDPFRYYISRRHPLFARRRISRRDLEGERVVWVDHERVERAELESSVFCDTPGQAMEITAFANDLEAALKLLMSGYGVVPMPRSYLRGQLASGDVRELRIRPPVEEVITHCVDKPMRPASPPVAFLAGRLVLQGEPGSTA